MSQPSPEADLQPPAKSTSRPSGCLVALFIAGSAALMGGIGVFAVFLLISTITRHSGAYQLAMQTAQSSPCVAQRLGVPLKTGLFVLGTTRTTNAEGFSDLDFAVSGPRGSGHMHVVATRLEGAWSLHLLNIRTDAGRIDILPVPSACN